MEHKKNGVGHAEKPKKQSVPQIKISAAKKDTAAKSKKSSEPPVVESSLTTLNVVPHIRTRSHDRQAQLPVSQPPTGRSQDRQGQLPAIPPPTSSKTQKTQPKNEASNQKHDHKDSNDVKSKASKSKSKETSKKKDSKDDKDKSAKDKSFPMRRAASVDIGGLGRKKKSRKKKIRVDQESLLAQHAASKENVSGENHSQRSGSVGARPNSLKLKGSVPNQANVDPTAFPTPVPSKRHSTSGPPRPERSQSIVSNAASPDVSPNDTSAILPPRPAQKPPKWRCEDGEAPEVSDAEDGWYSTFPIGQGYRKHGLRFTFPSAPYNRLQSPVIHKRWYRFIGYGLYAILAFLLFCPFSAFMLVLVSVCLFIKAFARCCCSCCNTQTPGCCSCGERLSLTERFWIQTERQSSQVVQSLVIVEYGLSVPQIINLVNNRVVLAKTEDGSRLYPRFSQRVIQTCSDFIWQDDSSFFIHNHVAAMPKGIESLEDLQDYISELANRALPFDRPLWEAQVLTDFGDVRDTVILFRMHPCLVDGVSMVKILYKSIADVEPVTTVPTRLGHVSCWESFKSLIDGPMKMFRILLPKHDFNLLHGEHIHLSGKKLITWSEPFSLSSAVKIKQVTRSTLNEVLMSVTAGSLRNYLILNNINNPFDMQTSIPVYYGNNKHASGVGNDVLFLKVRLPTNTEGAVPRLWRMKTEMDQLRGTAMFAITRRIFKLTYHLLAESLWNKLWIYVLRKCTCIVSSLPGPEVALRISSKQVKTVFYWFPPVQHVALAISFFTYGDRIQMAVAADRGVLPNPEVITKDFIHQVGSLVRSFVCFFVSSFLHSLF